MDKSLFFIPGNLAREIGWIRGVIQLTCRIFTTTRQLINGFGPFVIAAAFKLVLVLVTQTSGVYEFRGADQWQYQDNFSNF